MQFQGQYYIGPIQELECLGEKFKPTNEYKFAKVSPPEKDPEKTYEDDAQHVLITKNLANHLQNEIKIQESIFRERLEKSETGLPIVKSVLLLSNAHFVKLLTAETIRLVDQIQYVHTPPINSNMSTLGCFSKDTLKENKKTNPVCNWREPRENISRRRG